MKYNLIGVTVYEKPEFYCCDLCGTKLHNVYTVEKVLDEGEEDQEAFPKSIGSECYSKRIKSQLPANLDDAGQTCSVDQELSLAGKYARLATEELLFVFQVSVACSKARNRCHQMLDLQTAAVCRNIAPRERCGRSRT